MIKLPKAAWALLMGVVCLILLQGCGSVRVEFERWMDRTKAGFSKKSVQIGDHKIAYLEGGKGETIVLLHGFADAKDSWVRFARPLVKKYHVVIPDLPGFGDSSRIPSAVYDTGNQINRLSEFFEKLGVKPFHVVGNSLGGYLAGMYAAEYPSDVLSLCLMDTAGIANIESSDYEKSILQGVNPLIVETPEDYDRMLNFVFVTPPVIPGRIKKYLTEQSIKNREFNKKIFGEAYPGSQLEARLPDIKARTLVLWGDTDRIFPAANVRVIKQGIPGAKVVVMKNCGHVPMSERPEEASDHYLTFLTAGN